MIKNYLFLQPFLAQNPVYIPVFKCPVSHLQL